MSGLSRHLLALLFFAVLIGLLYHGVLLGHASLKTNTTWPAGPRFVGDPIAGGPITLPLEKLAAFAWSHLRLPVIDPYQGYGLSLLANAGVPVFPPEILFHVLIPGNYSDWNVVVLAVMAYGSYLLASSLGQGMLAALAVGSAFALAGIAPVNLNLGMLNPVAVLPFVLLSTRCLLDPASRRPYVASLGLATSVAMLALSGWQEVLPLVVVVFCVFTAGLVVHFHTLRDGARRLTMGAVSVLVGAAVGAVGYLPTLSVLAAGAGVNPPTSYLPSYPGYWLATTSVPSLTRGADPSWLLGSPFLVIVLALAVLISIPSSGRHLRWLVWPSSVLVVIGILGYVNAGHILAIFGFFPFDIIGMKRFLPFAWWLPWCLLLGVVISNASLLRWRSIAGALGAAALFDVVNLVRYREALAAAHTTAGLAVIPVAIAVTAAFVVVFAAGTVIGRHLVGELVMAAVVLVSCVYYLPTNFFPPAGMQATTTIRSAAIPSGTNTYLALFVDNPQLPVQSYTPQLFGPIDPKSYVNVLDALVPAATTSNGQPAVYVPAPTLYYAKLDAHFIAVLRYLGVDRIVSSDPLALPGTGPIARCRSTRSDPGVCLAAGGITLGLSQPQHVDVYVVRHADPVVDPAPRVLSATSDDAAVRSTVAAIRRHANLTGVPAYATDLSVPPRLARGVAALSRSATTESVHLLLRARAGGLVILRESCEPGMTASVNGRSEQAVPVDGGMWTAIEVPSGASRVTLRYVTGAVAVEFIVCGVGLALLALLWCGVAVLGVRRRRARRLRSRPRSADQAAAAVPQPKPASATRPTTAPGAGTPWRSPAPRA